MDFKKIAIILPILLNYGIWLHAQTEDNQDAEALIESTAVSAPDNFDYSAMEETLNYYYRHPLGLNEANREQLTDFLFLTPVQINNLLKYREEKGRFIELQELQVVEAFDPETIKKLLPYITLARSQPLSITGRHQIREHELILCWGQVLQEQKGYLTKDTAGSSYYAGSPQRLLVRYRLHYGDNISAAVTMEKDPGEAFFSGAQRRGFDFYSGNIAWKGSGSVRKLVLGDYSLQFGQGINMWSGLNFGKGDAVTTVAREQAGLKPYTSVNEMMFLRGAAAAIAFKRVTLTPFISFHKLDASLTKADSSGAQFVTSVNESGLHRTPTEIRNHNDLSELVYGTAIQYDHYSLRLGSVVYHTLFSEKFIPREPLYDKFSFPGRQLTGLSLYGNYNWQNVYFFGEASHSLHSGYAFLGGALASLAKQVSLALLYRDYQKDYYSFFNGGLAEGSNGTAERGFYSGIVISPDAKTEISVYTDVFRFPWLKYRADAPSQGHEICSRFSWSPNKKVQLILRYRLKNKQENDDSTGTVHFLQEVQTQNYRTELHYKTGSFQFRSRAEYSSYKKAGLSEKGILLYQDVIYKPMRSKWNGSCRLALFNTDSFNSGIYAYENDVLYSYSIPVYQNNGIRFYLNLKYKLMRRVDLSARYAVSRYTGKDDIGSGTDRIEGHCKSDIKMQIRFQF